MVVRLVEERQSLRCEFGGIFNSAVKQERIFWIVLAKSGLGQLVVEDCVETLLGFM